MFRSYLQLTYRESDKKVLYKIVDDEFEQVILIWHSAEVGSTDIIAIIAVYEERKLPVAANLIRALPHISHRFGTSIQTIVERCKKCKEYLPYKEDIDKYLVLL